MHKSKLHEFEKQAEHLAHEAIEQAEDVPTPFFLGGALGSLALSALLFMFRKRGLAMFMTPWGIALLVAVVALKQSDLRKLKLKLSLP
jgi:hypothetical protein